MPEPQNTTPTTDLGRAAPGRAVLLVHTRQGPRADAHIDWLIERDAPADPAAPEHTLRTFRVVHRIDRGPHAPFLARPIPDHRRRYLTYEGELSEGRGRVDRLVAGVLLHHDEASLTIRWAASLAEASTVRYTLAPRPDGTVLITPTAMGNARATDS